MGRATATADKLAGYSGKRDFSRTGEPRSGGAAGRGLYVIQHHWARREHHDFRLELGGVLVSFAVAKGPSLDPAVRRLAVRTEDHPISYADFEGTIPKGEYGGGTVMLWDRGHWTPLSDDPERDLARGELKFALEGDRIRGRFVLVRMNVEGGRENWLLIKERDALAEGGGPAVTERHRTSVASGRGRAEIERGAASRAPAAGPVQSAKPTGDAPDPVPPMLCDQRPEAPAEDGWLHEIKYDGYRIQAFATGDRILLTSREGLDWTHRFPPIRKALAAVELDRAVLDGEAVVFGRGGLTDFPALVAALDDPAGPISYVAFDLLAIGGDDLRGLPLIERKARLETALAHADGGRVRVSQHVAGNGPAVFEAAVKGGAEGIVSKKAESVYRSGRSPTWVKIKGLRRTDVVVVGYLPSERRAFRSLHCAVEDEGALRYVGGVGTGFSAAELQRSRARLDAERRHGPADGLTGAEAAPRDMVWVEPRWRIEVAIGGWTGDGHLRQARFLGWREDRSPRSTKPRRSATPPAAAAATRRAAGSPITPADADERLKRISHPDRPLYPDDGVTKLMLARYLLRVADRLIPHLDGRPVSFVRAPEGIDGETFFQRHVLPMMKRGIVPVPDPRGKSGGYLTIDGMDGLITAAQFGVIELHGWMARMPDLSAPDRMVFDLDPDEGVDFETVKAAALTLRDLLEGVGLRSFPLASGGKGLHVVVPLDGSQTFDDVGAFSGGVAKGLAKTEPQRFVAVMSKARRQGRIFIDWLRNRPLSTAILPWSPRARPGAPVAMPLAWAELPGLDRPNGFDLRSAGSRRDPWTGFHEIRQRIDPGALEFLRRRL